MTVRISQFGFIGKLSTQGDALLIIVPKQYHDEIKPFMNQINKKPIKVVLERID